MNNVETTGQTNGNLKTQNPHLISNINIILDGHVESQKQNVFLLPPRYFDFKNGTSNHEFLKISMKILIKLQKTLSKRMLMSCLNITKEIEGACPMSHVPTRWLSLMLAIERC